VESDVILFGLTVAEFEEISLKVCFGGLILYMLFIIGNLAKESKAGKYGTVWMFAALGLGFVGFIAKGLIARLLGIE
jgi:Ca2+/Na+ antiporter